MSQNTVPTQANVQAATPNQDPKTSPGKESQASGVTGTPGSADPSQNLTKEAAREAIRKLKLKNDDGSEEEVDETEVVKVYRERKQHQAAASRTLNEGKAAKKQAEEFISLMKDKQKLFDVIKKLGHDPRQLSEEYLSSILEEELLDPREKEFRSVKRELDQRKEQERQAKEAEDRRISDTLKAKYSKEYTDSFVEALKTSNLPPTKAMVSAMAKYIHDAGKMKFQMTADEAAKLVKEDIENAHRNLYGEADADTLVRLLGDQGLQKLRTYDTSRLKDPNANLKTPAEQGEPNKRVKSTGQRMSAREWREFNRK